MRSTFILGIALAACASMPPMGFAQELAVGPVRHHQPVRHHVQVKREAETIHPGATAQVPLALDPMFLRASSYPNGQASRPNAEWDCVSGTAGCSWEPYGWRTNE